MNQPHKKPFLDQLIDSKEMSLADSQAESNQPQGQADREEELVGPSRHRLAYRPQMMLIFRQASGEVDVLPYSHLQGVHSNNPDRELLVSFQNACVTISGTQLLPLFHYICEHRMKEIIVGERSDMMRHESCVVSEIRIVGSWKKTRHPTSK